MSSFSNLKVRQSQLIRPFGVGAMHTLPGNITYVTAGLKHWYYNHSPSSKPYPEKSDLVDYIVKDRRLQIELGVDHLRLPPGSNNKKEENFDFKIPLVRFPSWYVCGNRKCKRFEQRALDQEGIVKCIDCESIMTQVRFAAVCPAGHLQDFPWIEWVHKETNPKCCAVYDNLEYSSRGGSSLSDIHISCPRCKKSRSLGGILQRNSDGTTRLSNNLFSDKKLYKCNSGEVWHGKGERKEICCDESPSGVLINGLNTHYSHILSSIWVPEVHSNSDLLGDIDELNIGPYIDQLEAFGKDQEGIIDDVLSLPICKRLQKYTKKEIADTLFGRGVEEVDPDLPAEEQNFLLPEYLAFKNENKIKNSFEFLENRIVDLSSSQRWFKEFVSTISIIDKLRETSAMYGFSRLIQNNQLSKTEGFKLLWGDDYYTIPKRDRWLPANVVYGEGFMVYLNENLINDWEKKFRTSNNFKDFEKRLVAYSEETRRDLPDISPKFILIHTLSHLLMKRLAFNSGYNLASIKERIYCSDIEGEEMLGLLIYTASGDSEGSMGGLAKNGEIENIEHLINSSFEDSDFCTNDPVCSESTEYGGQGLYGLNGASCYACTLIPETSCSHFNSYLDRAALNDFKSYLFARS